MQKKIYKDKMLGGEETLSAFHFSGAGTTVAPVVIHAKSREEAEAKFRELAEGKKRADDAPIATDHRDAGIL